MSDCCRSTLICLHLASLVIGMLLTFQQSDVGATALLCASALFLILDRVALITEPVEDRFPATSAYLSSPNTSEEWVHICMTYERRLAMLTRVLSAKGALETTQQRTECVSIMSRLGETGNDVDDAIQTFRVDIIGSPNADRARAYR